MTFNGVLRSFKLCMAILSHWLMTRSVGQVHKDASLSTSPIRILFRLFIDQWNAPSQFAVYWRKDTTSKEMSSLYGTRTIHSPKRFIQMQIRFETPVEPAFKIPHTSFEKILSVAPKAQFSWFFLLIFMNINGFLSF